ncbi:PDZ domain-containing protein [Silvanigrella aquatica]|uniref:PDZ domain-containing protein n=1 Tax=Silvanigrella aquatica TaxID=1915309 RepID=A0A1L4CZA0_9BACT|nr:PDZ domain-containing protein [Silvanigrella aquatica]APJ03279.1 hypothetical protein AXG55_04930 [Silvanigrella aquatica]
MIPFVSKLKYKLYSPDLTIPQAEKVLPYAYSITGVVFLFGLSTTLISLVWKPSPNKETYHTSIPKYEQKNSFEHNLNPIITRNIFNVKGLIPDAEDNGNTVCPMEPYKSDLPYKITGILYGGSSINSLVVFESGVGSVYKEGDSLPQGGVLTSIEKSRILITKKQCPEYIALNYPKPPSERLSRTPQNASGASYKEDGFERDGLNTTATRQWVNNILTNNFAKTLEEAKASPNLVGGQVKGFIISNITPNSVYSKLGLKDGDIVTSISGIELNDAARAIQTLNSMRNENTIELDVIRGGQSISFKVNVQ